ncbi:MAG TPA: 3-dehydroquinate synthase [Bacteroidia bacterium]|jgi:3-dehydroquinate synthase
MPKIISTGYTVFIENNIAAEINSFLKSANGNYSGIFILVDENSLRYCYPRLVEQIDYFKDAELIEIESGEESKSIEVCAHIWSTLSEFGADRRSLFVNLGGGVISDLGGFIASTFKRGINYINIPTTLLAQVDASIGGKTGIDLNHLKNEVGVFSTPSAVFIDPAFLQTLDKRQLLSGYAEVIKHALIADQPSWKKLSRTKPGLSSLSGEMIASSVEIKNRVVRQDPDEEGIRKVLNFGHTIGHAIESYSLRLNPSNPLLHGEAIAAGMVCESYLSHKACGLQESELEEITGYLLKTFKKVPLKNMDKKELTALMKHDKKNEKGGINFSLLSAIGRCEINNVIKTEVIAEALDYYVQKVL